MKLVVFAHTPPPHHGQSYMVQLMLAGLGGDARRKKSATPNAFGIECYHVNARFSRGLADVGEFQGGKIFLIFWFCAQAIWLRFRHGVKNLYYVPAPGKRVALYRDWLVMFLCRPFFKKIILHWHAAGLAKWLETSANITDRSATYRFFRPVDLSLVLSHYNFADAEKLLSRGIIVVENGIPDPCPDFDATILAERRRNFLLRAESLAGKKSAPMVVNILFIAHCTREKGLFAAAEAVVRANRELAARNIPMKLKLRAAGNFVTTGERYEFLELLKNPEVADAVEHLGFVTGSQKENLLREAGLFLFPTRYLGENQPVNLIEAMAFGLPIVTTRWRSLPEMLPAAYPGLVSSEQDADEIAAAILKMLGYESGEKLRENFLRRFTLERHLENLATAIRSVEKTN